MIKKLFEAHLAVSDLERAMRFYEKELRLELGRCEAARRAAFYWVGERNHSMLGLWERPTHEIRPQHIAFEIAAQDLADATRRLKESAIRLYNFLNDGTAQPMVFAWMPAVAIYFNDPDGHELELIAPLAEEARPELGIVAWEEWQAMSAK